MDMIGKGPKEKGAVWVARKVPDGYVYLTKDADRMHGVELGMLKQFSGTVTYALPAGVNPDDYDSVVIWCKQFNVEIGRAYFAKKMM